MAHWKFDEANGTTASDFTGNFDGTLGGGATFVGGGISGNALSLDGLTGSLVNMGTSIAGFTTGDFSLVAWIKTTTTAGASVIAGKHEAGTANGFFLSLNNSSGYGLANKAFFYDSMNAGGEAISTTTVNDGAWHQIVGVLTAGSSLELYVDGFLEGTKAGPTTVGNAAPFLIGGVDMSGTPTALFAGLIDDVQLYEVALNSSEILTLFNNPGQSLAIPEPAISAAIAGLGILFFGLYRRKIRRG